MTTIRIGNRIIGDGQPCYIIAEAGVNHGGNFSDALHMIDVAISADANAVKFQVYRSEKVISKYAPKADYALMTTDPNESQLEMTKRLELTDDEFRRLKSYCDVNYIEFLATPFDESAADFLESLDVAAFKIPSGEINNLPYLEYIARKGKPMIISTGMSALGEVDDALRVIRKVGDPPIVLLHCVSNYPALPESCNLRAMQTMRQAFGIPIGFSDHTLGNEIAFAAVALGTCIIEKHFTLDKSTQGPDHRASCTSDELEDLVNGIRKVEHALGDGRKEPRPTERNTREIARKSLVAARDIRAGEKLTNEMIARKRPGTGLPPSAIPYIVGRRAKHVIKHDMLIALEDLE